MSRLRLAAFGVVAIAAFFGTTALPWGGPAQFLAHPARAGLVLVAVLLTIPGLFSGASLSGGRREDRRNRWIFVPLVPLTIAFAYLPSAADSNEVLVIDGDELRDAGFALYAAGAVLRVAAIVALGRRFSGLVAIQRDHRLETTGLYRFIRHPSYLGAIVAMVGWMLAFRSLLVVVLVPVLVWIVIARIEAEERLLASQFGDPYAAYRRRTWRPVPFVY